MRLLHTAVMKLAFSALLLMINIAAVAQGVALNNGESFVFEFASLNYLRPAEVTDSGSFDANFSAGTFSDGESVLVEIFSDSLFDTPLTSLYNHVGPASPLDSYAIGISWRSSSLPYWPDFQGVVRVTMISGDAQLNGFAVKQIVNGNVYSQSFSIPEPSSLSLGVCSAAFTTVLHGIRRRRLK